METQVTTKKETSLKPAQIKQLALDYLLDKRKSVSLFKMMEADALSALCKRLEEVLQVKREAQAKQAEIERIEKAKKDSAISKTIEHLASQGFTFDPKVISDMLTKSITPVDVKGVSDGEATAERTQPANQNAIGEGAAHVTTTVRQV
tara:strand:- start:34658 stop:35101 length:444 start_codon:yes stop_codon:yes gene_type:complete